MLTRARTVVSTYNPRLFPDVHHRRRQADKERCAHFKSDPSVQSVPVHAQGHGQTSQFLSHRETQIIQSGLVIQTNDIFALIIRPGACLETIRGSILKYHPRLAKVAPSDQCQQHAQSGQQKDKHSLAQLCFAVGKSTHEPSQHISRTGFVIPHGAVP